MIALLSFDQNIKTTRRQGLVHAQDLWEIQNHLKHISLTPKYNIGHVVNKTLH